MSNRVAHTAKKKCFAMFINRTYAASFSVTAVVEVVSFFGFTCHRAPKRVRPSRRALQPNPNPHTSQSIAHLHSINPYSSNP